jgi:hypothetical protein
MSETEPRQGNVRKQRGRPFAEVAQVTTNPNDAIKGDVYQSAPIKAMAGQRISRLALWAVIRAVSVHLDDFFGVALHRAAQR